MNIIFLKNLLNQTTTPGVGTIIAKSEDTHTDTNTHTLMHTHTHTQLGSMRTHCDNIKPFTGEFTSGNAKMPSLLTRE